MEDEKGALVQKLIDIVNEISTISDYRCTVKKQYCNLARRLKLLTPMFEEIRDCKEPVPEESFKALESLKEALESARDLLRIGSEGSRIYLVLERDQIMKRFQEVTACLEQALGGISYEKLDISDEVKEQVDLVLAQFRRAKGRIDSPDVELHENLLSLYNNDASEGPAVIRRVAEKLQLMEISDLTQESIALHEMVSASGGDPGEGMEKMSMLLKKIKDFVQTESPDLDSPVGEKSVPSSCSEQPSTDEPQGGMVDEALAILAILSSHPDGKVAIGAAEAVPVLVEVIGSGSPRNKENAAAVLVHLCSGDQQYLIEAQELGVMGPLVDLAQNGTDRGKRKAAQLLDRINRFVEQQKLAQAQAQTQNQPLQSPSPANAVDS
ncbi:U-box domain-containing protein 13 [Camellia lanceoleosa]|uniref:U-box domain-containing protein 13 n=1 Tax=Camellia lanceoleosa TaxID=1840588 RepID=A0ACC0HP77_9ERIC|nr:U-box domain-containing protein 13 [Camellia lanceoleosa]